MPNTNNGKHRYDDMLLKPRTRLEDMKGLMSYSLREVSTRTITPGTHTRIKQQHMIPIGNSCR
jgi:hypothetical protein